MIDGESACTCHVAPSLLSAAITLSILSVFPHHPCSLNTLPSLSVSLVLPCELWVAVMPCQSSRWRCTLVTTYLGAFTLHVCGGRGLRRYGLTDTQGNEHFSICSTGDPAMRTPAFLSTVSCCIQHCRAAASQTCDPAVLPSATV